MHKPATKTNPPGLEDRWRRTLGRAGLKDPQSEVFQELLRRHAEPHRAYHDLNHVVTCLELLDRNADAAADPASLELAFWFHDAIYKPLRGDNEEASALLATERLETLGADGDLREKVERLIRITAHSAEPRGPDEALLVDIDLAILGSDRDTYNAYEKAIRREYRLVPGPLYRRGRRKVLRHFLDRPVIYATESFRRRLEAPARANLERALGAL